MSICTPAKVEFILTNANAFAVLGDFRHAARRAGWTTKQLNDLTSKCVAGNYSKLICTLANHCVAPLS